MEPVVLVLWLVCGIGRLVVNHCVIVVLVVTSCVYTKLILQKKISGKNNAATLF